MSARRVGRYEIGRALGAGGMGIVYAAVAHGPAGMRREVALKVLHDGAEALRREAFLGGLLRHPHLVDVYEVGEDDGAWFCAMELCRDGAVADYVPLPPRAVVDVGLQVCEALAYAHEELGLVHLDLKPPNLLLDGATVKVADLGISRARGFEDDGRVRGTPGYMAPEQLLGRPVDARTDVWALGRVLQEIATGALPTADATFDPFDGGGAYEPPPPPAWLRAIVERCTEESPDARFPDMRALATALRALQPEGASLRAVVGGGAEEARPARRNDAFVGRERELLAVADRLGTAGVVTLKGPGGVGKSRLARVAADAYAGSGRAVVVVDLTSLRRDLDLLTAVAGELGVPSGRGDADALAGAIGRALAGRGDMLLVLDNGERVRDAGPIVARWCEAAPSLRVLATSREALGCAGEVRIELAPLGRDAAVDLLVVRARERGAEVAGDPALVELAERLDGLPLALELAAGRIGVLSPRDVLQRLTISLLRSGRAEASDREATLRGALDWSYELLPADEQLAFAELSVFRGGFLLEAAEAVLTPSATQGAVELLDALHQRSLVVAEGDRMRLLEPVRAYATDKLGADRGAFVRHAAHYARLGTREAIDALDQHGGVARRRALLAEYDNVLVGCERALDGGQLAAAAALLRAGWGVCEHRGPSDRMVELGERLLSVGGDAATAHRVVACAAIKLGRMDLAEQHLQPLIGMAPGMAYGNLAVVAHSTGRYDDALRYNELALEAHRQAGARRNEGLVLGNLGMLAGMRGRWADVERYLTAALAVHREVGDRALEGLALGNLGLLWQERGDLARAQALFDEAAAVHAEVGARTYEVLVLSNLGNLQRERGEFDDALATLERASRVARGLGATREAAIAEANLARTLAEARRYDEAEPRFVGALAEFARLGDRRFEGLATGNYGRLLAERGRFEEAVARLLFARDRAAELGHGSDVAVAEARLAGLEAARGACADAERWLASSERAEVSRPRDRAEIALARARVALARGDLAIAEREARAALALDPPAFLHRAALELVAQLAR